MVGEPPGADYFSWYMNEIVAIKDRLFVCSENLTLRQK